MATTTTTTSTITTNLNQPINTNTDSTTTPADTSKNSKDTCKNIPTDDPRSTTTTSTSSPPNSKPPSKKLLARSASMERIKKLNTFICSQNYFILPALIAWLRAPHDKLQASGERFIAVLKYVLFSTFLPRVAFKLCISATLVSYRYLHKINLYKLAKDSVPRAGLVLGSTRFIQVAVYSALATLCLQLVVCLYYLAGVMQFGGFVFLCSCLYLITRMNVSCLQFFLKEKEVNVNGGRGVQVQKRLSRRDILGKRTISNMNLI